ncbi:MAG: hypothetical protein ACI8TQ_000768 [Planctomycetota bacterium]|jgi:hypothetical protein
MRKTIAVLVVLAMSSFSWVSAQVGERLPEIKAVKWYNSMPLSNEDLEGKALLLEVFRTW